MTEMECQILGEITAIRYVLQELLGNDLAYRPVEHAADFKAGLLRRPARLPSGSPMEAVELQQLQLATRSALEQMVQRIGEIEADRRAKISAGAADQ